MKKLIATLCTVAMVVSALPLAFADVTNPAEDTVQINPGQVLQVDGKMTNKGTIIADSAVITVDGTVVNTGSMELTNTPLEASYLISNMQGGELVTDTDVSGYAVINEGVLLNLNGSVLGQLLVDNRGQMEVYHGSITSTGVENSSSLYVEDGNIDGKYVTNSGKMEIYAGDVNSGDIQNDGVLMVDYGDIYCENNLDNTGDVVALANQNGAFGDIVVNGDVTNAGLIQANSLDANYIYNTDTIYVNELGTNAVENAGVIYVGNDVYVGLIYELCFEDGSVSEIIDGIGVPYNEFTDICLDDLYIGDNFALSGVSLDSNVMAFVNGTPVHQGDMITGGGMLQYLASVPTYVKLFWKYIEEQNIEVLLRWVDNDIKQVLDEDGNEMVIDEDYWHVGITNYGNMKVYFTGEQLKQMEAGEYNYTIVTSDGVEHPYRLVIA